VPVLLTCLLAGCGTPVAATPSVTDAPATTTPTTSAVPTTTPQPTTGPAPAHPTPARQAPTTVGAGPVSLLPWPTADPARLQAAVDGGAQPWLLDPSDLAESYVAATYGATGAEATTRPGGTSSRTTVDVHTPDGARRTLTCAQPGRTGAGGIWLVTADTKA
jgi:hypothetical protein